jgi:hypothetical protein
MDFNLAFNKKPKLVNTLQEELIPQLKKVTILLLYMQKGVKIIINALKTLNLIAII